MSTTYSSHNGALQMGLFYSGRHDICNKDVNELITDGIIKLVKDIAIEQFGIQNEDCIVVTFTNVNGMEVFMASSKFRDGYDLWLLNMENHLTFRM
jgi:hypothetical protein